MYKKIIALFLILVLSISMLTACGGGEKVGSNNDISSKELVFATTIPTATIDPANGYGGWFTMRYGVGETLFKLDESMQPVPWLAESYENIDETTWKIVLKNNITFQNGKEMTGEAVKASLERVMEINDRAPSTLRIADIQVEGQTLIIKTSVMNPTLINGLCDPFACIIDVEAGTDFETAIVGTGPYMIEKFQPNASSTVVKYTGYWDGTPKLDRVTIKPISDGDTLTMALQSGEVDATQGMPYSSHKLFENNSDYKISNNSTSRVFMLYYNHKNPFLSNMNVRKAINMAINKENYASILLSGAAEPAVGAFPSALPYGSNKLTSDEFDLETAKNLLVQEGYVDSDGDGILEKDGKKLSLRLVTYSSRVELPILSEAIQAQLKEIGVEVIVEVEENANDRLKADDFDLSAYAYVTSPTGDPLSYIDYVFKTDGVSNFGHYSNAKVDALIEELRSEFDPQKRNDLALEIQQIALDEYAFTFMAHLQMAFVMKSNVVGLEVHPTDYYQINVNTDIR